MLSAILVITSAKSKLHSLNSYSLLYSQTQKKEIKISVKYGIGLTFHISKKHFHQGGMASSEWTRSVRAVRHTPVADYSAPVVNTMRHVAYYPPIAVLTFLLALLVSYFKPTLWRCGQL